MVFGEKQQEIFCWRKKFCLVPFDPGIKKNISILFIYICVWEWKIRVQFSDVAGPKNEKESNAIHNAYKEKAQILLRKLGGEDFKFTVK